MFEIFKTSCIISSTFFSFCGCVEVYITRCLCRFFSSFEEIINAADGRNKRQPFALDCPRSRRLPSSIDKLVARCGLTRSRRFQQPQQQQQQEEGN